MIGQYEYRARWPTITASLASYLFLCWHPHHIYHWSLAYSQKYWSLDLVGYPNTLSRSIPFIALCSKVVLTHCSGNKGAISETGTNFPMPVLYFLPLQSTLLKFTDGFILKSWPVDWTYLCASLHCIFETDPGSDTSKKMKAETTWFPCSHPIHWNLQLF